MIDWWAEEIEKGENGEFFLVTISVYSFNSTSKTCTLVETLCVDQMWNLMALFSIFRATSNWTVPWT